MARSLIIPDIHLNTAVAERIIQKRRPECDGELLMGDIFHAFGDDASRNGTAAAWLAKKIEEGVVVLAGNHDAGHYWPHIMALTNCPGWTAEKHEIIRRHITEKHIAKVHLAMWIEGWIVSHAGINPYFGRDKEGIFNAIENCEANIQYGKHHGLLNWGSRMELRPITPGGILWQDWNDEFRPISGINQIVGHTPGYNVRENSTPESMNICMDTGLNHYAIIDDGVVTVYDINHAAVQEFRKPVYSGMAERSGDGL